MLRLRRRVRRLSGCADRPQLREQLVQRLQADPGTWRLRIGRRPPLPFLSDLGTDAGQLGTQRLQCPSVLRPASLQGLVFRRRKPQCVQLAQMVFRVLARLSQFPFQPAVPFQPLAVVAVELERKSTRLNPVTTALLVCRLQVEKKKNL